MTCHLVALLAVVGVFIAQSAVSQTQQPQTQQQYSAPLTCYQQITAPSGLNNISFPNSNQNQYQQPNQQLYPNTTLPSITCGTSATACFKFVCAGTANYTIKGCQDPAQSQFSCQTLQNQCPGGQGTCYTCTGNNCNGALGMASSTSLLALLGTVGSMLAAFYLA